MIDRPDPIDTRTDADRIRTLKLAHRGALATLAGCAAIIASYTNAASIAPPPAAYPYVAVALGVAAIAFRQAAARHSRSTDARVRLAIAGYTLAAAIGGVGVVLVALEGQRQAGLLYAMGGAILALRPPATLPGQGR